MQSIRAPGITTPSTLYGHSSMCACIYPDEHYLRVCRPPPANIFVVLGVSLYTFCVQCYWSEIFQSRFIVFFFYLVSPKHLWISFVMCTGRTYVWARASCWWEYIFCLRANGQTNVTLGSHVRSRLKYYRKHINKPKLIIMSNQTCF